MGSYSVILAINPALCTSLWLKNKPYSKFPVNVAEKRILGGYAVIDVVLRPLSLKKILAPPTCGCNMLSQLYHTKQHCGCNMLSQLYHTKQHCGCNMLSQLYHTNSGRTTLAATCSATIPHQLRQQHSGCNIFHTNSHSNTSTT